MDIGFVIVIVCGAFLGGTVLGWFIGRVKMSPLVHQLQTERALLQERLTQRDRAAEEKLSLLQNARESFQDSFKALSSDALKSNNQSFLELATANLSKFQEGARGELEKRQKAIDELVKPLKESLEKVDGKIDVLEKSRAQTFGSLSEQIKLLSETQLNLRNETSNLVKALRTPHVRGRWGEIQLRRVVEMAGMVEYCDFIDQGSVATEEGRLRPDLVVKLPNNRCIVVDSKVPLIGYENSLNAPDEETRIGFLKDHARQVRTHITQLGAKTYWEQYDGADFVVLFIPGETFYHAALEQDPSLIEFGAERKVLIATPASLIGLLRVVAYGWRQEQLEESARKISDLGAELYDRVRSFTGHFFDLRRNLDRAVETYNNAAGSLERRVLVSARKLKELSAATGGEIDPLDPIDRKTRSLEIEVLQEAAEPSAPPLPESDESNANTNPLTEE